jgi:hypothetical protein
MKTVPTTRGFEAVPALATIVESDEKYPNPLFLIAVPEAVEVSLRYINVFAAVPVVSAAVTVTVNVAAFSIVSFVPLLSETVKVAVPAVDA